MRRFTTRVLLHDAAPEYYDELHKHMEQKGFSRTIQVDGQRLKMLPGEYSYVVANDATTDEVLEMAKAAAKKTKRKFSVFVTRSAGRKGFNLEPVD